jgi:hypothetical protein
MSFDRIRGSAHFMRSRDRLAPTPATCHIALGAARHDRNNHIKNTERLAVSPSVRVAFIPNTTETKAMSTKSATRCAVLADTAALATGAAVAAAPAIAADADAELIALGAHLEAIIGEWVVLCANDKRAQIRRKRVIGPGFPAQIF